MTNKPVDKLNNPVDSPIFTTEIINNTDVKRLENVGDVYLFGPKLGMGEFGTIREVIEIRTNKTFAMKLIPLYDFKRNFHNIMKEINILLDLTNIRDNLSTGSFNLSTGSFNLSPCYYDYFIIELDEDYIAILMEMIDGYTLQDIVDRKMSKTSKPYLSKQLFLTISLWLFSAIRQIHSLDIVHRDIKNSNIMVERDSDKLVLIDFGFACYLKPSNGFKCELKA
ncbi:unnamed protein product, partial [marine sediment metagenome]